MTASYEIQGRTVTLPVEVRRASSWTAQYSVPIAAAQRLVAPAGLEAAEALPGKGLASISFVRYLDGDLDAYNEVAFAIVVRRHDAEPASRLARVLEIPRGRIGVYIHQLPVNQTFTLEAGRTIWGYPKFLADIDIRSDDSGSAMCTMHHDGAHVLTLRVQGGGALPMPAKVVPTYTFMDGVVRKTEWSVLWTGGRGRRHGASLQLGNHPMSDELRSLGLPKQGLLSTSVPAMSARFHAPKVVDLPARAVAPH